MSIAGIGLANGRLTWAETQIPLAPLDRVTLSLNGEEVEGTVLVAPEQLLRPPPAPEGEVVRVLPRPAGEPTCDDLAGSDLPPLGSEIRGGKISGRVTALDPVAHTVTITPLEGGESVTVPFDSSYSS